MLSNYKSIQEKSTKQEQQGQNFEGREKCEYPRSGFRESSKGEAVFGVNGELGVDEEKDGLFDGVQSGEGSTIWPRAFHFHQRFPVHVYAQQYVFVAYTHRFQSVPAYP